MGFAWWQGGRLLDLAEIAVEAGRSEDAERWILETDLPSSCRSATGSSSCTGSQCSRRSRLSEAHAERAGQLWGAVEAEEQRGAIGHWENEREQHERRVLAHADPKLEAGREAGRLLSLEDAVEPRALPGLNLQRLLRR